MAGAHTSFRRETPSSFIFKKISNETWKKWYQLHTCCFSNYQQCRIFIGVDVISFGNWFVVYFHSPVIFLLQLVIRQKIWCICSLCAILIWYVPQLKCQHSGSPSCWHYNFRTYYIRMSHWPSCIICIMNTTNLIDGTTTTHVLYPLSWDWFLLPLILFKCKLLTGKRQKMSADFTAVTDR